MALPIEEYHDSYYTSYFNNNNKYIFFFVCSLAVLIIASAVCKSHANINGIVNNFNKVAAIFNNWQPRTVRQVFPAIRKNLI